MIVSINNYIFDSILYYIVDYEKKIITFIKNIGKNKFRSIAGGTDNCGIKQINFTKKQEWYSKCLLIRNLWVLIVKCNIYNQLLINNIQHIYLNL